MKHLVTAALLGVTALASPAIADDLQKITVVRGAPWSAGDAAIPFGIALGFFAEEGLKVDPVAVQGAGVMVPQLAQGALDFGIAPTEFLLWAAARGERFPVTNVLKVYPNSGFEFVTLADSPLQSLTDLKGKAIGIGDLSWGNLPMTRVYLADAGLAETDVQAIPVGMGPAAWKQLQDGNIAALNLFAGAHDAMEAAGIAIKRLPLPEKFEKQVDAGLITADKMVADNPDLVKRYLRAYVRSSLACHEVPESCAKSFWSFDPSSKPEAGKEAEWVAQNTLMNTRNEDRKWLNQDGDFGTYTDEDWSGKAALMGGAVPEFDAGKIDPKVMYTNEFVQFANDFDHDATIAAAKAWAP